MKPEKALYGCIQSALLWYQCLKQTLCSIGFNTNPYDKCIFIRSSENSNAVIIVSVDDLMIISSCDDVIDEVVNLLRTKFEITLNRGDTHSYLGMEFYFNDGQVKITMKGYIDKLLTENNIISTSTTPASNDIFTITDEPRWKSRRRYTH
jgi:hypothetical protein